MSTGHPDLNTNPDSEMLDGGGAVSDFVLSVKFVPMTNSSTDIRTRALIAALLASGLCPQILPSTSSNATPLKTIADIDIVTDLSHYLPVVRGTRAGEMIGKLRITTNENIQLRDIKLAILQTLKDQKLFLERTTIAAGARDVFLGWLHHSIPRFIDCTIARQELALIMKTPQEHFALSRKIVTIDDQRAEVIAINGVKEHEEALITALSIAFEPSQIRASHELASLTFIPKVIDTTTQLKFLSEHNEFLKSIKYSYIINLGDIDKPLGLAIEPSLTARTAIYRAGSHNDETNDILAISQSQTKLGNKIVYIIYLNTKHDTHNNLCTIFAELVKEANAVALYHDINDGLTIHSPATHISTSPTKRLKPSNPHSNPALLKYIDHLNATFPALTATTTTSTPAPVHQSYANVAKGPLPKAPTSLATAAQTPPLPPKPTSPTLTAPTPSIEEVNQLTLTVATLENTVNHLSSELTKLHNTISQLVTTIIHLSAPISSPPTITLTTTTIADPPTTTTNNAMDLTSAYDEDVRMSTNKRLLNSPSTPQNRTPSRNATNNKHTKTADIHPFFHPRHITPPSPHNNQTTTSPHTTHSRTTSPSAILQALSY